MCVAAFAWHAHPEWPLVAIGNRDEFHDRPAASLSKWDNPAGILAGRDLQSGGTWLGVSQAGEFVLVTNLRGFGPPDPARRSRGELVTRLLEGKRPPRDLQAYNPFNIIRANRSGASFLTNRPADTQAQLTHGTYGLSNGRLDEPWAKTLQLKSAVSDWLTSGGEDPEAMFDTLTSRQLLDVGLDPRQPSEITDEAAETPAFICNPVYGTRCSTVVLVDRQGHGQIIERRFDSRGNTTGETALRFGWPLG